MCEVAVWDSNARYFHLDGEVRLIVETKKPVGKDSTIHQYIGLKDIDDKKIYADSSICKINYFSGSDWIGDYCYFSFDTENLRYVAHLIIEKEIVDYEASCFDCISIVDTIQENKLNLIKEIKNEKADYVGFVSQ